MKQRFLTGLLSLVLLIVLSSCGSEKTKRISYDLNGEPETLDPQCASDVQALTVIHNIYEGLMAVDEKGNIVEGAAESYQVSEDGLHYQFQLRSGLTWSNGDLLTAHDFEFAFYRLFDPQTKAPDAESFYCIKNAAQVVKGEKKAETLGVKALSDTWFEIELEYANPFFLQLLTTAAAMPCNRDFFEQTEGEYGLEIRSILTNGSFLVASWSHGELIRLRKNSSYWQADQISLDDVYLYLKYSDDFEQSENSRFSRFLSGKTQLYTTDQMIRSTVLDSGDYGAERKNNTVWGLLFNVTSDYGKSGNFRRAIAYGIDRSRLGEILPETLNATSFLIPEDLLLADSSYRKQVSVSPLAFNEIAAKDCLTAAKSELGHDSIYTIEIIMPQTNQVDHAEYFSYLSQGLQKEIGVYCSVKVLPEEEYQKRIQSGNFTVALTRLEAEKDSVFSVFSQFMPDGKRNYSFYQNKNFSDLIEAAQTEAELSRIAVTLGKAEQTLLQDAVFIPLYEQPSFTLWSQSVSGGVQNSFGDDITFQSIKLS